MILHTLSYQNNKKPWFGDFLIRDDTSEDIVGGWLYQMGKYLRDNTMERGYLINEQFHCNVWSC